MESSSDEMSLSARSSRRKDFSDTPSSRGVSPVSSRGVFLQFEHKQIPVRKCAATHGLQLGYAHAC